MGLLTPQQFKAATDALDTAALSGDERDWKAALTHVAGATGATGAELIGLHGSELAFIVSLHPPQAIREFAEAGAYDPGVSPRVAAAQSAKVMQVVGDEEYDALAPSLKIEPFMDLAVKYDIVHGCQVTLAVDGPLTLGMASLRTARQGRIAPESTAAFASLAPHALAALRTRRALREQGLRELVAGLEYADAAAFLCAPDATIQAMTGAAERLVSAGTLVGARAGRLFACIPDDDRRLRAACRTARDARLQGGAVRHLVIGPPGGRTAVHVRGLPGRDDWGLPIAPRLLLIIGRSPASPSLEILRAAFSLTTAEAEIALALIGGERREAIALRRGASIGTVRQQVKSILAKAGVSREADLITACGRLA